MPRRVGERTPTPVSQATSPQAHAGVLYLVLFIGYKRQTLWAITIEPHGRGLLSAVLEGRLRGRTDEG